jgi:hypothetical protein
VIKLFINSTDFTDDVSDGTLGINEQIQNKADTANFVLNPSSSEPSENQEVLIYDTVKLVSASGTSVVIEDNLTSGLSILDRGKFRVDEFMFLDIGGADEEKVQIASIEEGSPGQIDITLVEAIVNSHSAGEDVGKLIFGGTITNLSKSNPKQLTDVEYRVSCTDFTKIFDRKLINDSWEAVDARYVINDVLNTTINFNRVVDDMDYENDAGVQAEWIESGDGDNPTQNIADVYQGTSSVTFPWTNSGGTATFEATPTAANFSEFTGINSGKPTKGNLTLHYKPSVASGITSIALRLGSSNSDYTEVSFAPEPDTRVHFQSLKLSQGSETGTPDWTAVDYAAIVVTQTTSANVVIDDLRVTADGSFTIFNFEETIPFDDIRASFKKPTVFIESLAKTLTFYWFIDYEKDIHFFDRETNTAPFSLSDTSNNFEKLDVRVDVSQIKNRQVVRGGTKTSDSPYTQVVQGDSAVREWILKAQFKNLTIALDDNTSTDTMEGGTTTTNVTATLHGLTDGDYIVNRTRNNEVRQITFVDANNFTVEAVVGQTSGDTFSKFDTAKTVGIENLVDETTVNYVSNFNEKSIRATENEATLDPGEFLLFTYNEIIPIRVQVSDPASIANLKALIGGDGIFDGAVITDQSLDSTSGARGRAQAEIDQWANPIVNITFTTDFEGLHSGQIISIEDTNKSVNDDFVIQKVKTTFKNGFDYPVYSVTAASTIFGIIEYFQKLSTAVEERLIDEDEVIDQIFSENVTMTLTDINTFEPAESFTETPTMTLQETSNTVTERDIVANPYVWQPDASDSRWNLAQWG